MRADLLRIEERARVELRNAGLEPELAVPNLSLRLDLLKRDPAYEPGIRMRLKQKPKKRARLTDTPINVRLPVDLVAEVDALVSALGTRSTVLRLAVAEGLKVLRRRYEAG